MSTEELLQSLKLIFTFHRWGENDEMVIQELSILDQREAGIISSLKCEIKTTIWGGQKKKKQVRINTGNRSGPSKLTDYLSGIIDVFTCSLFSICLKQTLAQDPV